MFGTRTFLLFAIVGCAIVNAEPRLRRSVSHPSTQEVETPSVDDSVAARSVEDPKSVEVSSEAEQDGYLKRLLTPNFKKAFGASAVAGLAFAANHVLNRGDVTVHPKKVEPQVPVDPVDVPVHQETGKVVPEKVPVIKNLQVEATVDPVKTMNLLKNADGWNTFQERQASILQDLAKTDYANLKLEQERKKNLPAVSSPQMKLPDQNVILLDQNAWQPQLKILKDEEQAQTENPTAMVSPQVAEFEERQKETQLDNDKSVDINPEAHAATDPEGTQEVRDLTVENFGTAAAAVGAIGATFYRKTLQAFLNAAGHGNAAKAAQTAGRFLRRQGRRY